MHSFGPSRGRIFFEALCALAISASLVGAWIQTGASALLAAAGVATLYGLVHPFGRKGRSVPLANMEELASEVAGRVELVDSQEGEVQPPAERSATEEIGDKLDPIELVAPAAAATPPAKAPRKSSGRKASAPKKAKLIELAPPIEAEVAESALAEEGELVEAMSFDDDSHAHIEPLFEPAPFARMPHRAFGRKAG